MAPGQILMPSASQRRNRRFHAYNTAMIDEPGTSDPSTEPHEPAPCGAGDDLPLVPLFPLPDVVLFPRAVLPLHIFEERYKLMTRHALEGDRQIAMALLRPGWEKCYYGKPAIEPAVCVGTILSAEELPDGKFNFLLQGTFRGQVAAEVGNEPYRLARVLPIKEMPAAPEVTRAVRQQLIELFTSEPFAATVMARQFLKILATPMPTQDIVDLAAFTFIEDAGVKQSLLADADVARRLEGTIRLVEEAVHTAGLQPGVAQVPSASGVMRYRNPGLN
jgi:Lon protease-like protein